MVANNREDFLFQLHNELHRIGVDASSDIFSDFEEHFKASASEGLSEEETCRRLGDVKEIARSYIDIDSSRINSIVAQAIEADRPHVSLTKPGKDVPADLNLIKDKEEKPTEPLPEYTPQHFSAEIYPNAQSQTAGMSQPQPSEAPGEANGAAGAETDARTGQTNQTNQSLGDAFGAAGRAIGEAAKAAGHAIGEAFSADAVKTAGRNAAEAAKNAGGVVAEKVKGAAENARSAHRANQQRHEQRQEPRPDAVPRPSDDHREYNTSDRRGEIPPQYSGKAGTGKGFSFSDVKGMKMNPSFGKLFGCVCLDLFVWSWLVALLAALAVEIGVGGCGWCVMHGLNGLFVGLGSYHIISRIFYGIAMISLGVILLLLGILLVKGIIKLVKHIVLMHVKALYDL